uniref:C-type lectin domain-containing protein n=1 Tax=Eptatretus burgeri TaxID=7764 RepID=A0A8C4ND00_EPTBU
WYRIPKIGDCYCLRMGFLHICGKFQEDPMKTLGCETKNWRGGDLVTVQSENNDLVFQQGTDMKQQGLFINWANGEPNNMKQNEGCAEMYVQRENETGKWNDEPCAKRKFALCGLCK